MLLFGLVYLTWFDCIPVALTLATVILVQVVIAATSITSQNKKPSEQKSDINDSTSENSISSTPNNNGAIAYVPSSESLSSLDEYHEDEDTLSLENLFPCDQSEVYASKKINYIIDELLQTEMNYVTNLVKGIRNYGSIFERDDMPATLSVEQKADLLGNVEEILALHEGEILPMMQRNRHDLKQLFDEFAGIFDKNRFYCYVTFTMSKKTSMQIRQDNREWLSALQREINDKLGIDSFLMQPIQRLTRYPLFLHQFISEFYKSSINCKPVLASCCKLETRIRHHLAVVNQSEEILSIEDLDPEFNILDQGSFRKSTEFEAYNHKSRKKYPCKIFLFDRSLVCTEVRKKRQLAYRCHFPWESIQISLSSSKCILLKNKKIENQEDLEFASAEAITVKQWMQCAQKVIKDAAEVSEREGTFSLPMDLVLMVAFGIWIMCRFL